MAGRRDLFFYGTLMDADVLAAVLGAPRVDARRLVPATLAGYRRFRLVGRSYPSLVPADADARVDGLLFKRCTPGEWARLAAYEDREYQVRTVTVETPAGPRRAKAFLGGPAHRRLDAGRDWHFARWLQRDKAGYLQRLV